MEGEENESGAEREERETAGSLDVAAEVCVLRLAVVQNKHVWLSSRQAVMFTRTRATGTEKSYPRTFHPCPNASFRSYLTATYGQLILSLA